MEENIAAKLTAKDDRYACALADKIISESQETDEWYDYFDDFASLLDHPKWEYPKVCVNLQTDVR